MKEAKEKKKNVKITGAVSLSVDDVKKISTQVKYMLGQFNEVIDARSPFEKLVASVFQIESLEKWLCGKNIFIEKIMLDYLHWGENIKLKSFLASVVQETLPVVKMEVGQRNWEIFLIRNDLIPYPGPRTYLELGIKFSISGERVKQINVHTFEKVQALAESKIMTICMWDEMKNSTLKSQKNNLKKIFKIKDEVMDTTIEMMGFSNRTYNGLKRNGIDTLSKLCGKSAAELLVMRNFGAYSLADVRRYLYTQGKKLRDD